MGAEANPEEAWSSAGLSLMATRDLTFPRPEAERAQEGSPQAEPRVALSSLCAPWAQEGLSPRQVRGSPLPPPRPPGEEVSEYSSLSHPSKPGNRACARPHPRPCLSSALPAASTDGGPGCWMGVLSQSWAGHTGRRRCQPSPVCLHPGLAQVCAQCLGLICQEDSPQGGRRTGGARPADADPQAGVSVFLTAASPR